MLLLNAGCGGHRPQDPLWVNLDELKNLLRTGTPERENLDAETNYVDHRLGSGPMPFGAETFDGVLCQHVIEHMPIFDAVRTLGDLLRTMKPGAPLAVSVPDAAYFRKVHGMDRLENAVELFGEPIHDEGTQSFFDYALFHRDHKQILAEDVLWALLTKAGFDRIGRIDPTQEHTFRALRPPLDVICSMLNRRRFSLVMLAFRPNNNDSK